MGLLGFLPKRFYTSTLSLLCEEFTSYSFTGGFIGIIIFITAHILFYGEGNSAIHYLLVKECFPPNVKWKRPSISILLSCVPVRLGPEDTTDFVSMILRGADWMLTSLLGVTNSQVSGYAVNLVSTHSSSTLNLLSIYFRVLASSYYVMLYVCGVCISSISYCSVNV